MALGNELLVILALTMINGFFSAAEIGILSVRRTRLQELAEEGKRGALAAISLRNQPEQFLATVQVGITFVGATAGAFGGATLEAPLAGWLRSLGMERGAEQLALALVVVFVSVLSIVLGELVPKSLALRGSERVSVTVARPLLLLSRIARPIVWLLTGLSNLILRPFSDQTTFTESRLSPDELQHLVEEAATAGSLSPGAGDIASRAIDLSNLQVSALLIPRRQVAVLRRGASREEVWNVLKTRPHSRYPIVDNDLDSVDGYVLYVDVVAQLVENKDVDLRAVTREVSFVSERVSVIEVLRTLQQKQSQLAVVIDEHGMPEGIVTIGDITEELLGDILNEHELPTEEIRREAPGQALVRADTAIQELNRELGTDLPMSTEYATLSGLLMHYSNRIMKRGEQLAIEGVLFDVVEATPRQVKLVRVRLPTPGSDLEAEAHQS